MRYAIVGIPVVKSKRYATKTEAIATIRERMLMGAFFGAMVYDTQRQVMVTAVSDDANGIMVQPLSADRAEEI